VTWVSEQTSLTFDGRDRTNLCLRKAVTELGMRRAFEVLFNPRLAGFGDSHPQDEERGRGTGASTAEASNTQRAPDPTRPITECG
jgi:hypothetical protein